MIRKFFELLYYIIMMVAAGAAVGPLLNGALAEACFRLLIAAIAAFWWREFRALESN